ncbi:hypothetical protein [Streptomyces sp. NPDC059168]|uniref:HalD/BesD family halogenase n=1 Tax=Streptomyces sp. NPDC059168 TaxID=3346753 RepID=UPI00368F6E29
MLTEPHIFPGTVPPGYAYLEDEPVFDAARDLSMELPDSSVGLSDLGYSQAFRDNYGSDLAVSAPFRLLSDAGVARLQSVISQLHPYIRRNSKTARVPAVLRGTAYRSRFVRDLSLSAEVTDFLSGIGGMQLVPTSYPHQLAHLNFPPDDLTKPNVGWHHDENAFVLVLMVHDPNSVDGGDFEYFDGTRHEGHAILDRDRDIPASRRVSPHFPGAGYAVLMQGSTILHRASPLLHPGNRISLVTSYDTRDVRYPDPNRFYFVTGGFGDIDPNAQLERYCRYVDYARHMAWRTRGKLADFIDTIEWTDDRDCVIARFEEAIDDAITALNALKRGDVTREEAKRLRAEEDARLPR